MGWREEWKQGPQQGTGGELRMEMTRAELGCQRGPLRRKTAGRGTEEQGLTGLGGGADMVGKRTVGGHFKVLSVGDGETHDTTDRKRKRRKNWLGDGDNELFFRGNSCPLKRTIQKRTEFSLYPYRECVSSDRKERLIS